MNIWFSKNVFELGVVKTKGHSLLLIQQDPSSSIHIFWYFELSHPSSSSKYQIYQQQEKHVHKIQKNNYNTDYTLH